MTKDAANKRKWFTNEEREEILKMHIAEFGSFDAPTFVDAASDPRHPAHEWFTWDDTEASGKYRVNEAREFARVRITTQDVPVEKVGDGGTFTINAPPLLVAPPEQRSEGGGYILANTEEGRDACRDAARIMLQQFIANHGHAIPDDVLEDLVSCLDRIQVSRLQDETKKTKKAAKV